MSQKEEANLDMPLFMFGMVVAELETDNPTLTPEVIQDTLLRNQDALRELLGVRIMMMFGCKECSQQELLKLVYNAGHVTFTNN